jgi:hypothetical protein
MAALLGALLLLSSCTQGEPLEVPAFQPLLERKDLNAWWRPHSSSLGDVPWRLRPWQHEIAQGVDQAWVEGRPLLLWLEDGHPFAAAPARALAVRELWTAPELAAPLRSFVLTADDLSEILRRNGAAAAWLKGLAPEDAPLQPGILLATADGRLLGACDGLDAKTTAAALGAALKKWETLSAELNLPAPPERPAALPREARDADSFPLDGLAFEVFHRRLLDASAGVPEAFEEGAGLDYLWIAAADTATVRPAGATVNARSSWAPSIARRFARAALADGADAEWLEWSDAELKLVELEAVVQVKRQGKMGVRLEGRLVAARGGSWQGQDDMPFSAGRWQSAEAGARGARAKAVGWLEMDATTGAILYAQIVVLAQHFDAAGVREAAVLLRTLSDGEEGTRFAPRRHEDIVAASGATLHRTLYAEQAATLDGSLAEPVWAGAPWSQDFSGAAGTRAKALWNADFLYLAAWAATPELALTLSPPGGGASLSLVARADGTVEGLDGARAVVQSHGQGAQQVWVYELQLPWPRLNRALERASETEPAAGAVWLIDWKAGSGSLTTRLVFEPSRTEAQSFGSGTLGGFR